jgi:hypothetical protein
MRQNRSTASADNNRLDTGTLGFSDIHNRAEYEVEHQSAGISSGGNIGGQFAGNMANGLLTGVNGEGSATIPENPQRLLFTPWNVPGTAIFRRKISCLIVRAETSHVFTVSGGAVCPGQW